MEYKEHEVLDILISVSNIQFSKLKEENRIWLSSLNKL